MKLDAASHLLRRPISFELFLLVYLVFALVLQMINIYKTNFYLIDFNLVLFIVVILSRRLAWCGLQELQSHWSKHKSQSTPLSPTAGRSSSKSGLHIGKSAKVKSEGTKGKDGGMNVTHWLVVLCTVLVIVWSIVRLIQHTSLFNLLFLFYPLLLYLSLFGFTLEPRPLRSRYRPPKTFLHHIEFNDLKRINDHLDIHPAGQEHNRFRLIEKSLNVRKTVKQTTKKGSQSLSNNNSTGHNCSSGSSGGGGGASSAKHRSCQTTDNPESRGNSSEFPPSPSFSGPSIARYPPVDDSHMFWETSLLLPAMPDEVRQEVDLLLSDLVVRLKQLLFNSLLCAYYVGFIPVQFADSHLSYDRWWCIEHGFLVWANSFVILASHLLPPSYLQILYQCALHLGCWTRCVHNGKASTWSPNQIWVYDAVVQWNGESFRAEGLNNVAIPCESTQECFYLLFHSRLHVHTWLLILQCISVTFQIVVLLRSTYWYQVLSMSVFLIFNYFVLYKLLHNRLWLRRTIWLT